MTNGRVYVIILNWNGWGDTIECLESVFRSDYPDYRVIVCDNYSQDGSLGCIKAWAQGRLGAVTPCAAPLRSMSFPPIPKPVRFVEYDRVTAESGGDPAVSDKPLILIRTGANLGFAGGTNVGLRYALAKDDFSYVWLLNSDAVTRPDALSHMVRRMSEKPEAGMCGATLLYYGEPDKVQALGGAVYNKWFSVPNHIGLFRPAGQPVDVEWVERRMDYVAGASLFVSKAFLRDVGLMSEDYFLYCEELDWALRARGRYAMAFSPDSVVYHREGGTIGSSAKPMERGYLADFYGIRNRLMITSRYYPWALPMVRLGFLVSMVNRIRRRQWDRVGMIARLMFCRIRLGASEFRKAPGEQHT